MCMNSLERIIVAIAPTRDPSVLLSGLYVCMCMYEYKYVYVYE